MITRVSTAGSKTDPESRCVSEIDACLSQIAAIRRDMKKTDAEIRRLETSTRRKLNHIRANLHVEKAA